MKAIRRLDQYLRLRGDIWHYVRRLMSARDGVSIGVFDDMFWALSTQEL